MSPSRLRVSAFHFSAPGIPEKVTQRRRDAKRGKGLRLFFFPAPRLRDFAFLFFQSGRFRRSVLQRRNDAEQGEAPATLHLKEEADSVE